MKAWSILTPWEKVVVAFLAIVLIITGWRICSAFIEENSVTAPKEGGIYTEGMIGKLGPVNPLYATHGSISHDITQLVFSGLTRYDPETRDIIPDLADIQISKDKKEYTFIVKKGATWHDGAPVTSDDILFTYNDVLKNPDFNGVILSTIDLSGLTVAAIDDRTVKFTLNQPDSFFLAKTMTGILPQHLLGSVPVRNLPYADFNQFPVGSGPYRVISIIPMEDYTEVSLEAYENYYGEKPYIRTLLLKIFPDFDSLLKKQSNLSAIRNIPPEFVPAVLKKGKLVIERYYLPQYVAVFINTDSPILKERKVRLALQLGTDKKSLAQEIDESRIIDTPLLEIDQGNWIHQFSVKRANGALFEAGWQIPDKDILTETRDIAPIPEPSPSETTPVTYINQPNGGKDFETKDSRIVIGGTNPAGTAKIIVNDYELKKFDPEKGSWTYVASAEFQNLLPGDNLYEVFAVDSKGGKKKIDSIKITYSAAGAFKAEEDVAENANAVPLPVRRNKNGKPLQLTLITSQIPADYGRVAQILKEQWKKIGVDIRIELLEGDDFQERLNKRKYDLLIFGQNLGYNLDAYPYWHSSQAKEGGYNLSQFKNFIVDSLLERVRLKYDKKDRQETLEEIQTIMSEEVSAVFLYSPTYYFALSPKIQNVTLENLATSSDRFAGVHTWYIKKQRTLKPGVGITTFFSWLVKQF